VDAAPIRSLWSASALPGLESQELVGAVRAEVAVIGAGYTGLSAALHLCEGGRDVVVLEATEVGERASGLNGGQVIPGVKHDPDTLEEMFGAQMGTQLVATVAAGPDLVFDLIRKHGIACNSVRSGWLQPATSEGALEPIRARVAQWQRRGAPVALLNQQEMSRLTGSERYCGGWIDRRAGTVQPLSYVRGLAHAAHRAGGRIFSRTPASSLARAAGEWRIDTPRGTVSSPIVILATDAYTDRLVEPLRRTLVAVPSWQVATAPIPEPARGSILPQGQSASDTWHLLRYFRLDASGRLVLGSRGLFADMPTREGARHLHRAVREIYPQLAGVPFDYHWGGLVAMTRDHLPHLHELGPGLLAGVGYNGRGLAMATLMGRLLAQRALGASAVELGFPVTPVRPIPLHGLSRIGAHAAIQYLRLLDGLARARSRVARPRGAA